MSVNHWFQAAWSGNLHHLWNEDVENWIYVARCGRVSHRSPNETLLLSECDIKDWGVTNIKYCKKCLSATEPEGVTT